MKEPISKATPLAFVCLFLETIHKLGRLGAALSLTLYLTSGCTKTPAPPEYDKTSLEKIQVTLIEEARERVINSPESPKAWGELGQFFHAVDFFPEALRCYEVAARLDANSPRWPYYLGLLQLQEQPDLALTQLERAATLAGRTTDAPRLKLAQALIERGQFNLAVPHLEVLLKDNPLHSAARLEMTRVHLENQDLDAAIQAIGPALTNAHTARPAIILLSQIRLRQGNPKEAQAFAQEASRRPRQFDWPDPYLREVLALRADRQRLQDHINTLLIRRNLPEAEKAITKLQRLFPDDPEGFLLWGRMKFLQGNCRQAEAAFQRHLQLKPQSLNGLIQFSLSLLCQEQWAKATSILEQTIALKPDFAEAHSNLGLARSKLGDTNGAIASYKEVLRLNPGDTNARTALDQLQ